MTKAFDESERNGATIRVAASEDELRSFLARCREIVDARLEELIPSSDDAPCDVHKAIRWSLFAGGKRFRPALLIVSGEAFGAALESLVASACAFEMIHTYSLIHDDLPAMDDDDLRRGLPTCHVKFGEATAILAGDALNTLAFQTIAEDETLVAKTRVHLIRELARAAGTPRGMIAGQCFDLAAERRAVDSFTSNELDAIHRHKTGALIVAAARAGAIIARASDAELEAVSSYAEHLGLLFQITDDLLDVTASAEDLGKTPGKDARAGKATYPALYGLEGARRRARQTYEAALSALDAINRPTAMLRAVAAFTLARRA